MASIINPSLETTHPTTTITTTTTTTTTTTNISDLLSELAQAISEREEINDEHHPTPGIDPAVLQQLQAVSAHMQTMNDRLSKAVWQIDNEVHARMDGLSSRLDSIGSGLEILVSRSDGQVVTRDSEKAVEYVKTVPPPPWLGREGDFFYLIADVVRQSAGPENQSYA